MTFALPMFGNFAAMVSIYAQDGTVAVSHVGIEMGQGVNTKVSLVGVDISRSMNVWDRQLSQYSDWLWAGLSGDRIPMGVRFSTPVQTGPGAHPASCTIGTESFPGVESGRGVMLTAHPLLVPRSKNRVYLHI
jgi:hypothetical protein